MQRNRVAAGGFRQSFRSLWRVADVIGDSELGYDIEAARYQKCIGDLHELAESNTRIGAGLRRCGSGGGRHKGLLGGINRTTLPHGSKKKAANKWRLKRKNVNLQEI